VRDKSDEGHAKTHGQLDDALGGINRIETTIEATIETALSKQQAARRDEGDEAGACRNEESEGRSGSTSQ
jgi:hypothetical protein